MYAEKFRYKWFDGAWYIVYGATYHDCARAALEDYGQEIELQDLQRWTGSRWEWFV